MRCTWVVIVGKPIARQRQSAHGVERVVVFHEFCGVVVGEVVAKWSSDPGWKVELLAIRKLEVRQLLGGSIGQSDSFCLRRSLDEATGSSHKVVAHQPAPVLCVVGASEGGECVDFPVDSVAESGFCGQCRCGDDAKVFVVVDIQRDLAGDVLERKVVRGCG